MRIKAYIRLQRCKTVDRSAFVDRHFPCHGVAAGHIAYYAVEGGSWSVIRRTLKTFNVVGHSMASRFTVQAWAQDIGDAPSKLYRIYPGESVPTPALHNPAIAFGDYPREAPELTSFGVQAIIKEVK